MFSNKPNDSQASQAAAGKQDIYADIVAAATTTTTTMQAIVPASVPTLAGYRLSANVRSENSRNPFLNLPTEIFLEIAKFLQSKDIIQLLNVCRELNELFKEELQRANSEIFRRFSLEYRYMKEMKAVCDDEYQQAAIAIQNSNDVSMSIVLLSDRPIPASSDRVTYYSANVGNVLGMASCVTFLGLAAVDACMLLFSDQEDRKLLLQFNVFILVPLLVMALAAIACTVGAGCNNFMRSCQHRYTLFTSGREKEEYNKALKNMEAATPLLTAP